PSPRGPPPPPISGLSAMNSSCTMQAPHPRGRAPATPASRPVPAGPPRGALFDPDPSNTSPAAPQGLVPYGTTADPGPCGPPSAALPPVRTCDLVAAAGTGNAPNFA